MEDVEVIKTIHASNPVLPEFTLCGMAFDTYVGELGQGRELRFAKTPVELSCPACKSAIRKIRQKDFC